MIGTTGELADIAERLGATRVLITIAKAPASVLVTGVSGSVGGELCRQLCAFAPKRVVLVDRSDNALFELYNELSNTFQHVSFVPQLADVLDERRMDAVLALGRPSLVFHTVDYRHVAMLEAFPSEAVKINIGATHNVAELAHQHGVNRFVLVSDQKAINPISVMGATMRVAESMLQTLARHSKTRFTCIRLGNVLISKGNSVASRRPATSSGEYRRARISQCLVRRWRQSRARRRRTPNLASRCRSAARRKSAIVGPRSVLPRVATAAQREAAVRGVFAVV